MSKNTTNAERRRFKRLDKREAERRAKEEKSKRITTLVGLPHTAEIVRDTDPGHLTERIKVDTALALLLRIAIGAPDTVTHIVPTACAIAPTDIRMLPKMVMRGVEREERASRIIAETKISARTRIATKTRSGKSHASKGKKKR